MALRSQLTVSTSRTAIRSASLMIFPRVKALSIYAVPGGAQNRRTANAESLTRNMNVLHLVPLAGLAFRQQELQHWLRIIACHPLRLGHRHVLRCLASMQGKRPRAASPA